MDDGSLFIFPSQVTEEGLYDISDNFFMEWWPNIKIYKRAGKLRFIHPEKNGVEIALSGIKGWQFRLKEASHEGR